MTSDPCSTLPLIVPPPPLHPPPPLPPLPPPPPPPPQTQPPVGGAEAYCAHRRPQLSAAAAVTAQNHPSISSALPCQPYHVDVRSWYAWSPADRTVPAPVWHGGWRLSLSPSHSLALCPVATSDDGWGGLDPPTAAQHVSTNPEPFWINVNQPSASSPSLLTPSH